jgi:serine/threonine protein kinase
MTLPRTDKQRTRYQIFGPYRLHKTIGQGEFGKVKLAYHLETSKEVAIKFVPKKAVANTSMHAKLAREIGILQTLKHKYIVDLLEVIETESYIGMIMEYASGLND